MYVKITELPQHPRVWYYNKLKGIYQVDWCKVGGMWELKVRDSDKKRGGAKYISADDCRPYHKKA